MNQMFDEGYRIRNIEKKEMLVNVLDIVKHFVLYLKQRREMAYVEISNGEIIKYPLKMLKCRKDDIS